MRGTARKDARPGPALLCKGSYDLRVQARRASHVTAGVPVHYIILGRRQCPSRRQRGWAGAAIFDLSAR